jgi:hypothetical protein
MITFYGYELAYQKKQKTIAELQDIITIKNNLILCPTEKSTSHKND